MERVGGLDSLPIGNWLEILSPGEVQRLIFARLFYQQPSIASVYLNLMAALLIFLCFQLNYIVFSI